MYSSIHLCTLSKFEGCTLNLSEHKGHSPESRTAPMKTVIEERLTRETLTSNIHNYIVSCAATCTKPTDYLASDSHNDLWTESEWSVPVWMFEVKRNKATPERQESGDATKMDETSAHSGWDSQ